MVRRIIRQALARADIGVYRISSHEAALSEKFDVGFLPEVDTVIDVGVAYGTGWLYSRFPDADLVLIDPVPNPELARTLGDRPHTFVEAALGATSGTAVVNVDLADSALSSLNHRSELTRTDNRLSETEVRLERLDDIVDKTVPSDHRMGLKIDTEGYEMEVLAGAAATLQRCDFVVCEVSVLPRFEDNYRVDDLVLLMREAGFGVRSVLSANRDGAGLIRFIDLAFFPISDLTSGVGA